MLAVTYYRLLPRRVRLPSSVMTLVFSEALLHIGRSSLPKPARYSSNLLLSGSLSSSRRGPWSLDTLTDEISVKRWRAVFKTDAAAMSDLVDHSNQQIMQLNQSAGRTTGTDGGGGAGAAAGIMLNAQQAWEQAAAAAAANGANIAPPPPNMPMVNEFGENIQADGLALEEGRSRSGSSRG